MSSSFFLKNQPKLNKKKRKEPTNEQIKITKLKKSRNTKLEKPINAIKRSKREDYDEEIPSDEEEYESGGIDNVQDKNEPLVFSSDGEVNEETPQDKRLRLAKQYLQEIERQEAEKTEEDGALHDHVSRRLQTEYLDSVGKLRKNIACTIEGYDLDNAIKLQHRKQHLPICCMALTSDNNYLFTGAKTAYVLKWDLKKKQVIGSCNVQPYANADQALSNQEKTKRRCHIIAITISSDMRYLALADGGKFIQIWCPHELKHLKTFQGHRDIVTCLVFRKDTHELYSGSKDRAVKIWSLDEMAYVESLFGHQASITSIDALSRERALTSGGPDCTLRVWKITEESQLIFNGHRDSIESVRYLNDENFVSIGQDGSLCLWSALKKKPLHVVPFSHGKQENGDANWLTALTCVINTDLIATGSCDGFIRLWQATDNYRKLKEILQIPVKGFINNLLFNNDGSALYAAIGQEHHAGRWWRLPGIKNQVLIIDLLKTAASTTTAAVKANVTQENSLNS